MPHLAQGFAVFSGEKMPIVGFDGALSNDTFREQLIANAQAAVDVLVEKGVTDKNRIAIAGNSFGFQYEERSLWKGQQAYASMSPFFMRKKLMNLC